MEIFEILKQHDHEQLLFCHDASANYKGLIAIHNTTLGPALGAPAIGSTTARPTRSSTRCGSPRA